jgi:hypothetical protein
MKAPEQLLKQESKPSPLTSPVRNRPNTDLEELIVDGQQRLRSIRT